MTKTDGTTTDRRRTRTAPRRALGAVAVGIAAAVSVLMGVAVAIVAFVVIGALLPERVAMYAGSVLVGVAVTYATSLVLLARTRRRRVRGASWSRRTSTSDVTAGITAAVLGVAVITLSIPLHSGAQSLDAPEATQYAELSTGSRVAWWKTEAASDSGEPPIVFLHGGPGYCVCGSVELFDRLADEEGRDVYYFDQPGAGLSDMLPADEYSIERLLDDLEAFRAEVVEEETIALLGHSFGGFYAEAYASAHPQSVEKVALVAPGGYSHGGLSEEEVDEMPAPPAQPEDDSGARSTAGFLAETKVLVAALLMDVSPQAAVAFMPQREMLDVSATMLDSAVGMNILANVLVTSSSEEIADAVLDHVAETAIPTLIVRPEFDYVPWVEPRSYRDANPNAVVVFAPKAAHQSLDRDDEVVYEPVRAFFAGEAAAEVYTGEEDPYFFYRGE